MTPFLDTLTAMNHRVVLFEFVYSFDRIKIGHFCNLEKNMVAELLISFDRCALRQVGHHESYHATIAKCPDLLSKLILINGLITQPPLNV